MQKQHRTFADFPISSFIFHLSSLQFKERFTLIELLVVIAIIAILAGLMLPALNSARDKALESECISRKKQLFLSIGNYMQDADDFVPGGKLFNETSGVIYPVLLQRGYLGSEKTLGILSHCPKTLHLKTCSPHNNANPGPSAGVNANFHLYGVDGIRRPYRRGSVRSASKLAYLADTRGWADNGCEDGKVAFSYLADAAHFGFFHGKNSIIRSGEKITRIEGGSAVITFFDGHTSPVRRDNLLPFAQDSAFYNPQATE